MGPGIGPKQKLPKISGRRALVLRPAGARELMFCLIVGSIIIAPIVGPELRDGGWV